MGRRKLAIVNKKPKKKTDTVGLINSTENATIKLGLKKSDLDSLGFKKTKKPTTTKVIPKFGSKKSSDDESDDSSEDDVPKVEAKKKKIIKKKKYNSDSESDDSSDSDSSDSDSSDSDDSDDEHKSSNKYKVTCKDCKARDIKIKEQQAIIDKLRESVKESNNISSKERFSVLSKVDFVDVRTGKKNWPKETKLRCRYDQHTFDTRPISIIEKIDKKSVHGFWYFCSFNCALSQIMELGGPTIWNRVSNLHKLYEMCYKKFKQIKPADSIDVLKSNGGPKTIEQFRKDNLVIEKKSEVVMPPMAPLIPVIENHINGETKINSASVTLSQSNNKVRLKRDKPLPKKSGLTKSLGLKIKKK